MKNQLVFVTFTCLLLIVGTVILTSEVETVAQAAQTGSTPTPEAAKPGYTNYSGYYRMRCWPACHTMNIPESIKGQAAQESSTPTPEAKRGYTNYSGYYRMRCWPACHTKDIPESIKKN
jgi:hypothetical protein